MACLGKATYIDISKIKKSASISADHISIRHTSPLIFKTQANVQIKRRESASIGGLFVYDLIRALDGRDETSGGKIEVLDGKRSLMIDFSLFPMKKGGCSRGSVRYY